MVTNCPNCCAPLNPLGGLHCDYCGTWLEEPDDRDYETFYDWSGSPVVSINRRTGEGISAKDWPSPPNLVTR